MPQDLRLSCQCGSLQAIARLPKDRKPTRVVCYCNDCQCAARFFAQADRLLDEQGGTDILQMSPASFSIRKGREHLGNMQLSSTGIYRWYASCCNTPLCNTPANAGMPYLGLLVRNLSGGRKLDSIIGPVSFGVGAGQRHPIHADWPVAKGFGLRGMLGTLLSIGRWRMAGDQHRSELMDGRTGKPVVEPTVLTAEQRAAAQA